MPQIAQVTLYTFEELSDHAKQRARDWYRGDDGGLDYNWWDSVYEDASTIAALMGIDVNQKRVTMMNGKSRYEPAIFFSGFWSQGDGASFEATWAYVKGCAKAVASYASIDVELQRIARELQDVQRRNFYALSGRVTTSGNYSHSHSMRLEIGGRDGDCSADTEQTVLTLMRDFADWIYKTLEREHEYLTSDESIDETLIYNEYTFDADGDRCDIPATPIET